MDAPISFTHAGTMAFQLHLRHAGQQIRATTSFVYALPIFKSLKCWSATSVGFMTDNRPEPPQVYTDA